MDFSTAFSTFPERVSGKTNERSAGDEFSQDDGSELMPKMFAPPARNLNSIPS
jgi:hypothetical protein